MVRLKGIEAQFELIYEKKKKEGEVALLVCVTKPGGGRGRGWRVRGVGVQ